MYQNLYNVSSMALKSLKNINEPYCDTFRAKTLAQMNALFFVSQHQSSEQMMDECFCIYAGKHEHKNKVVGGERGKREAKL